MGPRLVAIDPYPSRRKSRSIASLYHSPGRDLPAKESDSPAWQLETHNWLVVWNMFYFPFHIWDVILPIDELIFFRGVGLKPPTSYKSKMKVFEWKHGSITYIQRIFVQCHL